MVTGATGFIGGRLVHALLRDGFRVRCLVRKESVTFPEGAKKVVGDLLQSSTLAGAMSGIDTAFYLVHSMAGGRAGFEQRDREAAENFTAAAGRAGVQKGNLSWWTWRDCGELSEHLASRLEVAKILKRGSFSTTFLRAAVIIGAGGASFEMIRSLVERLPLMIAPRWVSTRCQPIAVADVVRYLVGCLMDERTAGDVFDLGRSGDINLPGDDGTFCPDKKQVHHYFADSVSDPQAFLILGRLDHPGKTFHIHAPY